MAEDRGADDQPLPSSLERLHALTEKLASPTLLVRIVEALPDALVVVNEKGNIVFFNRHAEFLFGYMRLEVIGSPIETLLPESLRARHEGHRKSFLQDPRSRPMGSGLELLGRHKTGREFPVEVNLEPLQTEDGLFVSAIVRRRR